MSELRFGYYDCIINPPRNIGLAGYASRATHGFDNSGVHDDLYARALYLGSGDDKLIIITLDLCGLNEKSADAIRDDVSRKLKIPVENVMINVAHTHSGPQTSYPDPGNESSAVIDAYICDLRKKIITISSQAAEFNFKGRIFHETFNARLFYNRRYITAGDDGNRHAKMLFTLWRNPWHDTNGIVDTNIPILVIERVDEESYDPYLAQAGMDRVVLFNVPAHPVVMGENSRYVSADYPGAARRCIEDTLGPGTRAMFLLGACGNVNPFFACQNNFKSVEVLGNAIGYGICAALSNRKKVDFDGLAAVSETIRIENEEKPRRIIIQTFKIGKAAIVAVSCECFTELGIRIRGNSGFTQTLVATNSNGGGGYIPTSDTWDVEGGYELPIAIKSGFERGLLEKMGDIAVESLKKLMS